VSIKGGRETRRRSLTGIGLLVAVPVLLVGWLALRDAAPLTQTRSRQSGGLAGESLPGTAAAGHRANVRQDAPDLPVVAGRALSLLDLPESARALASTLGPLEGAGGTGHHLAALRAGVWLPLFQPPAGDEDGTVPAKIPLYIISEGPPTLTPGEELSYRFEAAGGAPPYQWSMDLDAPGFALRQDSGLLTGTADRELAATLAVHVTDSEGAADSAVFTLRAGVWQDPEITTASLPSGSAGRAYEVVLQCAGGAPPLAWELDGALPEGVSFDADQGALIGEPVHAFESHLRVLVRDARGREDSRDYSLVISSGLGITTPALLDPAAPGALHRVMLDAEGGALPYSWRLAGGALPMDAGGNAWEFSAEGELSGRAPAADILFRFEVEVTDATGERASKEIRLPVRRALTVVPSREKAGIAWRRGEATALAGEPVRRFIVTRRMEGEAEGVERIVHAGLADNFVDRNLATGASYIYTLHAVTASGRRTLASTAARILPFTNRRGVPGVVADPYADAVRVFRPLSNGGFGSAFAPGNVTGPPDGGGTFAPAAGADEVLSLHARAGQPGAPLDAHGGAIVMAFEDNILEVAEGPGLTVFENVFFVGGDAARRFMEPATVAVALWEGEWFGFPLLVVPPAAASSTPAVMDPFYYRKGFAGRNPTTGDDPTDPARSGGDTFDLAELDLRRRGVTWIRYIRLQSTGDNVLRDAGGRPVRHVDVAGALSGDGSSGFDLDAVVSLRP
jgi:hypothetical protein